MWDQVYTPIHGSLGLSAACAALPILVLLLSLGVFRLSAWKSGLLGLIASIIVAAVVYVMPVNLVGRATAYRPTFGLFPIARFLFWALGLSPLNLATRQFPSIERPVCSP